MFTKAFVCVAVIGLFVLGGCKKDSAPAGGTTGSGVPAQLVAAWTAQSATVNGTATALSTVLQWEATTVSARVTVNANGTYSYTELDNAGGTTYTASGTVTISGTGISMAVTNENGTPVNPPTQFLAGTFVVAGNQLTVSTNVGGNAIVIIFTK